MRWAMPRKAVSSIPIIYIERILKEYTDDDHSLTVSEIKHKLCEVYHCDISIDKIKQLLEELWDFYNGEFSAESDGICNLYPTALMDYERLCPSNNRSKRIARMRGGVLSNAEISYVSDSLRSLPFLRRSASDDLVKRIKGLQSCHQRRERRDLSIVRDQTAKPYVYEVINVLEGLDRAISEHLAISCDYGRYIVEPMTRRPKFSLVENDFAKRKVERMSPYLLVFMDEHYYLVGDWGTDEAISPFRTLRVDLMRNLTISEDGSDFKPLKDEGEVSEYMKGAVSGFGGTSELVRIRCNAFAIHYVIERFSEFDGFRVVRSHAGAEPKDRSYEVEFLAVLQGFKFWAIKQLQNIEVLEPVSLRKEITDIVLNSAYVNR
ncbi:WYL domain-containing protein [Eggerthellaceae bacterium zg-887]|nr:WYL domain-containing protein [Xiamenia xianingshaonis]